MRPGWAAVADAACVAVFAVAGRGSHAEAASAVGALGTAAPFLVGGAVGWLAARAWRAPTALRTGLVVWPCTVAGGMLVRVLAGYTAQWPFVVVATIALGILLLGWRGAHALVVRRRVGAAHAA